MGAGGVGEDSAKGKRKRNSAYLQESISDEPKRTRVHAQRKFAQGAGGAHGDMHMDNTMQDMKRDIEGVTETGKAPLRGQRTRPVPEVEGGARSGGAVLGVLLVVSPLLHRHLRHVSEHARTLAYRL